MKNVMCEKENALPRREGGVAMTPLKPCYLSASAKTPRSHGLSAIVQNPKATSTPAALQSAQGLLTVRAPPRSAHGAASLTSRLTPPLGSDLARWLQYAQREACAAAPLCAATAPIRRLLTTRHRRAQ